MTDLILNPYLTSAEAAFLYCMITPVLALVALLVGWRYASLWIRTLTFWTLAVSGPIIVLLWRLMNAITNALGLDSLMSFILVLVVFGLLGAIYGLILRRVDFRLAREETKSK